MSHHVCQSVGHDLCYAKIDDMIDIPFGTVSKVGSRNDVIGWSPDPPWEWAIFWGDVSAHYKLYR